MAMTTTMESAGPTVARPTRIRAMAVAGAAIAAVVIWAIAVPLLGVHLQVRFGASAPQSVGIDYVIGASVIGSLAAWGLLAWLERSTARARSIWTVVAIVAVLVSVSLPLSAGVSTSTKVTLILMHLAIATILVPVMRRTSQARFGE